MYISVGFPSSMVVKNPPTNARNAGDLGLAPGSVRSPGERNGNPLQYSCLDNSLDRGAWWVTVHGVSKSRTQLSTQSCKFSLCLEISEYLPITQDPFHLPKVQKVEGLAAPQLNSKVASMLMDWCLTTLDGEIF